MEYIHQYLVSKLLINNIDTFPAKHLNDFLMNLFYYIFGIFLSIVSYPIQDWLIIEKRDR